MSNTKNDIGILELLALLVNNTIYIKNTLTLFFLMEYDSKLQLSVWSNDI